MKRFLMLLVFVSGSVFAGENTDKIAELKAEITQRQEVIQRMKNEGQATGRLEMTVFRLQRELERLTFNEEMLKEKQ